MSNLQQFLESRKNKVSTRIPIPYEFSKEINTYTQVEYTKGNEDKWFKVYYDNTDAKYGQFMVNPSLKQWRNVTFDEFYGGGIVD